jgi:hypothetical protein
MDQGVMITVVKAECDPRADAGTVLMYYAGVTFPSQFSPSRGSTNTLSQKYGILYGAATPPVSMQLD